MQVTISSEELQKIPDVLQKLVPGMDVSQLKQLLQGVTFPAPGAISVAVALSPSDTLTMQISSTK